jgi:hypothetical protein
VVKIGDNKLPDIGGGAVDIYSTAPFENREPNLKKRAEKREEKRGINTFLMIFLLLFFSIIEI